MQVQQVSSWMEGLGLDLGTSSTVVPNGELLRSLPGWLRPHIAAIEDTRRAGFRFHFLPAPPLPPTMLHALHNAHGAMNYYAAFSTTDAVAARLCPEIDGSMALLWREYGSVTDVVFELMQLPPHGSKGAPKLARPLAGELWAPPLAL